MGLFFSLLLYERLKCKLIVCYLRIVITRQMGLEVEKNINRKKKQGAQRGLYKHTAFALTHHIANLKALERKKWVWVLLKIFTIPNLWGCFSIQLCFFWEDNPLESSLPDHLVPHREDPRALGSLEVPPTHTFSGLGLSGFERNPKIFLINIQNTNDPLRGRSRPI